MNAFMAGQVNVTQGLGWVAGAAVEPRLLPDYRWGRLYSLLANDSRVLAWGVDVNTAVEVSQTGAVARGQSAVLVLDGRAASFSVGSNGALGARYVVLDTYVDGDALTP